MAVELDTLLPMFRNSKGFTYVVYCEDSDSDLVTDLVIPTPEALI